jgi:MFS family permease
MRGVTATLLNASGTLIGFSIGPLLAGGVSQLLGGGSAIRYAMATIFLLSLWAGLHFWLASRTLARDLERARA